MGGSRAMLVRRLGAWDAMALVVSNVVGVGIFTTPGLVAEWVPHPVGILGLWLLGGGVAVAGAVTYAELATRCPRAGGEYVYLREAFGPLWGFLTGWTSFIAGFSGAIAAAAVGFAAYVGALLPAVAGTRPVLVLPLGLVRVEIGAQELVAILVIVGLTWVHRCGVELGRHVQNVLAGAKVLVLLAFSLLALGQGRVESAGAASASVTLGRALLALIPIFFAYSGWNAAAYVAEEVRDPERTLPRSLIGGALSVTGLYVLFVAAALYVLPIRMWSGEVAVGARMAEAVLGGVGGRVFTGCLLVVLVGCLSAMIMVGPRVYYAMARDGLFVRAWGRLHPRYGTPAAALWAQAGWSVLLVVLGAFEQLLIYTGFAVVLFSAVAGVALFVLRRRGAGGSFRGHPVMAALFVLVSGVVAGNAVSERPVESGLGLGLIAAGIPLYLGFRRRGGRLQS